MTGIIKNNKGVVLLSVLSLTLIFIIVVIPLIIWSLNEVVWTNRSFMKLKALNLADAGAELAVWEIVHNEAAFSGWSGTNPRNITIPSFTDNNGDTAGDIHVECDNYLPGHYLITSTGYIPDMTNVNVRKTVKVDVFPHRLFNNGLFGYNSVTLTGISSMDSYDSSQATYPLSAGENADLGTNGTLTLQGASVVHGDVFIGENGTADGVTSSTVTGELFYMGDEVEVMEVPSVADLAALPNLGDLSLASKDTDVIPSGNYHRGSISVGAQATLTIEPDTRIYVEGDLSISGTAAIYTGANVQIYLSGTGSFAGQGIINATGVAGNLQLYGLTENSDLSFTGGSEFYGTVYAPLSSVYMAGGADYFGAVIAEDVDLSGNMSFHYDSVLSENGPTMGYDISYWQED